MEELTSLEKTILVAVVKAYGEDLPDNSLLRNDVLLIADKLENIFNLKGE